MAKPVYKRVLLKISGEALAGDKHTGLDFEVIGQVCDVIKECLDMGVQVGLVVGGGNFWRGAKNSGGAMERTRADHMGMLATVMNCLAVADVCEQKGIPVRVQTAIEMRAVAEPYIRSRAIRHLEKGRVVIFGAGTGNPYFSTDTAAVLRGRPHFHISIIMDVSPFCDCHAENDVPIIPDVGMLASFDPVALDLCCADLCNAQQPLKGSVLDEREPVHHDHFTTLHPTTHWQAAIDHGVRMGLGSREYELITVE